MELAQVLYEEGPDVKWAWVLLPSQFVEPRSRATGEALRPVGTRRALDVGVGNVAVAPIMVGGTQRVAAARGCVPLGHGLE